MTFCLGWLLGAITFALGWAIGSRLTSHERALIRQLDALDAQEHGE